MDDFMQVIKNNSTNKFIELSILSLFISFFFLDWMADKLLLIPRQFTWLPELLTIVLILYMILSIMLKNRRLPTGNIYLLFYLYLMLTLFSLFINKTPLFSIIVGSRVHLKFLPIVFLPFFYKFSDRFIVKLMKTIFFLSILQCPVSIAQRFYYNTLSGDPVGGTLGAGSSGILSLFNCIIMIFWTSYYFKCKIKKRTFQIVLLAIFFPMAINETKISIFLIILFFFSIFILIPEIKMNIKSWVSLFCGFLLVIGVYIFVFNSLYNTTAYKEVNIMKNRSILTYVTNPEKIINYIYYAKDTTESKLNRIPQIIFAFDNIKKNNMHFIFGVGAGNASNSFFSEGQGIYYKKFEGFEIDRIFIANMLWEYGIVGTLFFFFIISVMFIKIYPLRNLSGINGVVAIGVLGMNIILIPSTIYLNTIRVSLFVYFFWFLSGYLMNLIHETRKYEKI